MNKKIRNISPKKVFTSLLLILLTVFVVGYQGQYVLADGLDAANHFEIYNNSPNWIGNTASCGSESGGVTAGAGLPAGAAFPNLDPAAMANAINTWIAQQNPKSELSGLGTTIVADAKNSNVNPFLIVAIAKEESSLSDPSDYNVSHGNNSFGREAGAGQPSFQGAASWYKWSSVEASVDYTAPENQGAKGGGDIASYLRDQFGAQIDNDNLTALFLLYAPPSQNNTQQYITNVTGWVNAMITLTSNPGSSTTTTTTTAPVVGSTSTVGACATSGTSSCSSTNGTTATGTNAAILCEAEKYAGIYYLWGGGHESYSAFRAACPEASISAAGSSSSLGDPGPCAVDCSGLVSVALDGAYNQSYIWTVNSNQMTGAGGNQWTPIPITSVQAGDIVTLHGDGDDHVEIVDHFDSSTGILYTFGAHHTGTRDGEVQSSPSSWTGALRWSGPT